ncbi:MAG TPA: nuclear transport factor 2 family protein [Longimicrobiales bacterium]
MRRIACISTSSVLVVLLAGATACARVQVGSDPAAVGASTQQQLAAAMQQSAAAWNRGDLDGFLNVYKADAQTAFMGPTITYGLTDIKARYARSYFKDGKPKGQLTYDDLHFRHLADDHVLMTGRWHLTDSATGQKQDGYYTLIWERTPAGWKIIHDHSS